MENRLGRAAWAAAIVVSVLLCGGASGAVQKIVLPLGFDTTAGGFNASIPIQGPGRTQVIFMPSQLASVPVGSRFTGLELRQASVAFTPWPPNAVTVTDYQVRFAIAIRSPANIDGEFAKNMSQPVLVISGTRSLPKNAYPGAFPIGGTTPEGWGPLQVFDTPYGYNGDPLIIEIRHSGYTPNGGLGAADAAIQSPSAISQSSLNPNDPFATAGSNGPIVMRLTYEAGASCPADLNGDQQVDDADFLVFVVAYNVLDCADAAMPAGCPSDLNKDGFVDDSDFLVFVVAYDVLVCP